MYIPRKKKKMWPPKPFQKLTMIQYNFSSINVLIMRSSAFCDGESTELKSSSSSMAMSLVMIKVESPIVSGASLPDPSPSR